MTQAAPPDVDAQIDALELADAGGLLICDVDEVVFHFLRGLETHLESEGYWLDAASFALNGNVRAIGDNQPATTERLHGLLHDFFARYAGRLELIDGAADAIAQISAQADVVFLTNLPVQYEAQRRANLDAHGLDVPVLINAGPKGPAVARLAERSRGPCVFIDDAPSNVTSVQSHAPQVHVIHFVQDLRFAAVVDTIEGIALRTGSWRETGGFLNQLFGITPP
jgi:hypothetical protein